MTMIWREPTGRGSGAVTEPPRLYLLRSGTDTPCGVEAFGRRIAEHAGADAASPILGRSLADELRPPGSLVVNLPVVAWKRAVLAPILAALTARRHGLGVVVVLHEWSDLDPKRRLTYGPLLLLARSLLFSCPAVADQFSRSWLSRLTTARRSIVPVPPNVTRPEALAPSPHRARLAAERAAGRLVLGCFGSIYPKKQPTMILEVAAELLRRGHDPVVVFAGSFIRGTDAVERDFTERVSALGLEGRVSVTGYIQSEAELYGIFEEIDVFVYRFSEGLTPRRASVFACLLSGKPVVVNAPRDPREFDGHSAYRALLDGGSVHLTATDAGASDLADAVLAARQGDPTGTVPVDIDASWAEAVAAVAAAATPGGSRARPAA